MRSLKMNKNKKLLCLIFAAPIIIQLLNPGCASAPKICESTPTGSLGNKINTIYDEYCPAISSDTTKLFFTSTRGEEMKGGSEDLFYADKYYDKTTILDKVPAPIATGNNEGSPVFLKNSNYVLIARSHCKDGYGGTDIYSADISDTNFVNLRNLGSPVNTTFWDSQPAISSDRKTLIFASDRPGGLGGVDLWNSTRINDTTWTEPKNLGPSINTTGNEYSPYLYDDAKETILFFATDGRKDTVGKLDIYYAYQKGDEDWYQPININSTDGNLNTIGEVINTSFDEIFPLPVNNKTELIYASNNPAGCGGFDLYKKRIKLLQPCIELDGKVINASTRGPIELKAIVKYIDPESGKEIITMNTNLPSSKYLVNKICTGKYIVKIQAENYFTSTETINITPSSRHLFHPLTPLPGAEVVREFNLKEYNVPFFVTGYYRLNVPENLTELNSLLNSKLKDANYIEKPGTKYNRYAQFIQKLFQDTVFTFMADSILPRYINEKKQYLEIEIFGYTDPRFISGPYYEDDINFENIIVKKGDNIDNSVLSNLRAYYTREYIDKELMKIENYKQLKNEGRIKYVIKGKGADLRQLDFDVRRRIQIIITKKYFNE
jgi:hypothetical protein